MKSILITICLSLCFSFSLLGQESEGQKNQDLKLGEMFETEVIIEKPGEAFTKIYGQEGYEDKATESKIVAMFIPVAFEVILEDFQNAKENDERVEASGEIPYGEKIGFYNQIEMNPPKGTEKEKFTGIISILPVEGGTINVSAVCPRSMTDTYVPLFLKVMETVSVKK